MKVKSLFLCLMFSNLWMFAQNWCLTTQFENQLKEIDSSYLKSLQEQNLKWAFYNGKKLYKKEFSTNDIYQIPIVIHVIHTGETIGTPKNPSDATLFALVDELNQEYAATWFENPNQDEGGTPIPFEFILAQRTPDCEETNGIVRIDGSALDGYSEYGVAYPGETTGALDSDLKALSIWPNTDYLNIWIVSNIQGGLEGSGVAGYAYYPGVDPSIDGVVLHHSYTNWAITHEVGHSFGLRHTFEGAEGDICPINDDCTTQGDLVCDTDPHLLVSGCPTNTNTCTGTSFDPVNHNFMNYSWCPDRFSEGQKERLIFILENYRHGLITSLGTTLPEENPNVPSEPIAANCEPSSILVPNNEFNVGIFNVNLSDLQYTSSGYTGDGYQFYIDHTLQQDCYTQLPLIANLAVETTYTISITTGFNSENVRGWIDFNNNGIFEVEELIISSDATGGSYEIHTANFEVPNSAILSETLRMRIASDYQDSAIPQPCSSPTFGQTEDFMVIIQETLSVASFQVSNFKIYPNPTKHMIQVSKDLKQSKVYNMSGKQVLIFGNQNKLDVSQLSSGIYFLECELWTGERHIKKFVKI
ncbi:GEVED domain-containing protein [Mangrovimonas sp. ST2L15]|uniref:zinc-dependent metalloprotease n=1 Tax=Mangrovimonas sp. ST2L15 TaxID=1645916 RepID=UPI0009EB819A|nr:GEVED domain-containing protein [Mangrovimonas sp. ST2L15]